LFSKSKLELTQQTAAGAEESASASQQMKAQADAMNEIVAALEELTSGKRAIHNRQLD
jgi:nucleoid-associated protein YgaU